MARSTALRIAASAARLSDGNLSCQPLPSLLFLTDFVRTPDPAKIARNLPRGTGVILRHYEDPEREALARALSRICKRRGLVFIIGGDAALAQRVGADGVHLPEALIDTAREIRRRHPRWLITTAAHSAQALRRAAISGVDAALLSPVFGTASHPDQPTLGPLRFRTLVQSAAIPVYGLGGITVKTIRRLERAQTVGIAVIGAVAG